MSKTDVKEAQQDKFGIAIEGNPIRHIFIQIPIDKWASDFENGAALLHGKIREAETVCFKHLLKLRDLKKSFGVIKPN